MGVQENEPVVAIFQQDAFPHTNPYIPTDELKLPKFEERPAVNEQPQTVANPFDRSSLIDKRIETVAVIGAGPAGVIGNFSI
jgi:hypothetical protein